MSNASASSTSTANSENDIPLPLFEPLLVHLHAYYKSIQHARYTNGLRVAAAEVDSVKPYVCDCATCKKIAKFYAVDHHDLGPLTIRED